MITIERSALLPALDAAVNAVERRTTIPILANVMVAADGQRVMFTATDLDVEIVAAAAASGTAATFTIPAMLLRDAVRKMPEGGTVAIDVNEREATIAAGRSRFRLPTLPASDFPTLSAGEFAARFRLMPADLAAMLASVRFAVSNEETRYYLNGIHWHVANSEGEAQLVAVATDGHRLARRVWPLPEGAAGLPGIILPTRTIDLLKLFTGGKEGVQIEASESKVRFSAGDVVLTSKLIDGRFPDYVRVMPAANTNRFTLDVAALKASVDRVITISAGVRGSAIKFSFGREAVRLFASNPDAGTAEDELPIAAAAGDDVEIGFNGRYCLDMLAASPAEKLDFVLGTPGDAARIEPAGDPSTVFVLMPMRV